MKNLETALSETISILSKQLNIPVENITEVDLISDLADDSIQLFEILTAFENHYHTKVSYEDVVGLETVLDIANYVQQKT